MRFRPNIAVVFMIVLLLSGCASMGNLGDTAAGLVGRVQVPAEVDGRDYAAIEALEALEGGCLELARAHRQDRYVFARTVENQWLPDCRARIETGLEARRFDQEMDRLVDQAYQREQELRRQREQREAEERRIRESLRAAQEEARKRSEESEGSALDKLRERLDDAHIHEALADVPDQPMAYAVGQTSQRSMKEFLACLEVGYPNDGYDVDYQDDELIVVARQANMLRGDVDIRTRFVNIWNTWTLESLGVAEMRATKPQDRFVLAQNLLAGHCYGVDERL